MICTYNTSPEYIFVNKGYWQSKFSLIQINKLTTNAMTQLFI